MSAYKRINWVAQCILIVGLFITTIAIFVPFSPGMLPTNGLDPSWVMGLQQAIVQGLSFGREIIFTYGPYAPIFTQSYHPSTDSFFLFAGLYLAVSYWACLIFMLRSARWYWTLPFFIIFIRLSHQRETLFLIFPLLGGCLILKTLFPMKRKLTENKLVLIPVALALSTFGLLALVKGTLLILYSAVVLLCAVLFTSKENKLFTILCLSLPITSLLFFWLMMGQSIADLPDYFVGLAHITSGYTEAMALDGNTLEIVMYLLASILILLGIMFQTQLLGKAKLFLFCIYFLFLFFSFKASFVRHDSHALIAAVSILASALLLPFVFTSRALFPVAIFALLTSIYIENHYITNPFDHKYPCINNLICYHRSTGYSTS